MFTCMPAGAAISRLNCMLAEVIVRRCADLFTCIFAGAAINGLNCMFADPIIRRHTHLCVFTMVTYTPAEVTRAN